MNERAKHSILHPHLIHYDLCLDLAVDMKPRRATMDRCLMRFLLRTQIPHPPPPIRSLYLIHPLLTRRFTAPSYFTAAFHPSKSREYREHRPSSHSNNAVIRSIAWNNLGNRIACGLNTNLVRVWNPDKPEAKNSTELKGHLKDVEKVVWDPMHPDKLASCCNGQVKFWDYRSEFDSLVWIVLDRVADKDG